jgi:flagellar L-ring protein precursor FlgH
MSRIALVVGILLISTVHANAGKPRSDSSLGAYIGRVTRTEPSHDLHPIGSLWSGESTFANLAADYKARTVGDLVIINIAEQTLAEASGAVDSQRSFSTKSGITALAGKINTAGVNSLLSASSDNKLQGKAQTSSNSSLRTSVAGQVVAVLPNGNLVVEAKRMVSMNDQKETVLLRGVARPGDVSADNTVLSTQLSDLEIELRGKGVISEATRRPNWIWRALLRLLGI